MRALWLAWGAVVALLAYPSQARILGQQTGIMGSEDGIWRPATAAAPAPTVTIGAMPYARTVSCGSYTLTGTATDVTSVAWAASPSGASGACTGTTSWSCVVDVDPDATGEGVETITVTATGDGGTGDDDVTIGFPFKGTLSSCYDVHNVDGSYNSTLANLDAVATWVDGGPAGLDVAQGTGTAQPTFKTSIVGGNPVVHCDGGDRIAASTTADWTFVGNGTSVTVEATWSQSVAAGSFYAVVGTGRLAVAGRGFAIAMNDSTVNDGHRTYMWNAANAISLLSSAADVMPDGAFSIASMQVKIDATPGAPDVIQYTNGVQTATSDQTFSSSEPSSALTICASNNTGSDMFPITGDVVVVRVYTSALTSTQRGINKAVDEWRLGSSFPVTP